ncbi:MAG: substrate-binding domain-containing protein [Casimicrobiaceae bacterium]
MMRTDVVVSIVVAIALSANSAVAADVQVLSAAAVKGPLVETAKVFELETKSRVSFDFATAGKVDSRVAAGERPDVVVNTRARIDASMAKSGILGTVLDLGTVRIGIAVRAGAPKPDISTVEAFRAALVAAQSVAYTDPAAGGTAGSHFAALIDKLGIADVLASKRRLATDGLDVMRKIQRGDVDLGVTQVSEILLVDRTTYVGPLPEALQLKTIYSAFVPQSAGPAARAFAAALASDKGRARFDAAGFEN